MAVLLCILLVPLCLILLVWYWCQRRSLKSAAKQLRELELTGSNVRVRLRTPNAPAEELLDAVNILLELRQAERSASLERERSLRRQIANVSHDLRTPLTAICGYLELLDKGDKTPEQARYLALIAGRAEAMKRLTEELLRYSVAAGGEEELCLEPVDLNAAVEEAVAFFYGAFVERGIAPAVSLPEERIVRQLDRAALSRVLGNLLNNALKYSGGDLSVVLEPDGSITLSNAAPELDEVQVGRLFDRFYTVESARRSTGLGLSIARSLTERMGGTIAARYEEGRLAVALFFPERR